MPHASRSRRKLAKFLAQIGAIFRALSRDDDAVLAKSDGRGAELPRLLVRFGIELREMLPPTCLEDEPTARLLDSLTPLLPPSAAERGAKPVAAAGYASAAWSGDATEREAPLTARTTEMVRRLASGVGAMLPTPRADEEPMEESLKRVVFQGSGHAPRLATPYGFAIGY